MGIIEVLRSLNQRIGMVYMDVHGDSNTPETTPSGIISGMDVAIATGRGPEMLTNMFGHSPLLPEENVVLYGVRDLDALEAKALAQLKVKVINRENIGNEGAEKSANQIVAYLRSRCDCVYLHVDLDVLDASVFLAAGLSVPNGLLKDEFLSTARALAGSRMLCCLSLMTFDAAKDVNGGQARNVVSLVAEAFSEH